MSLAQNLPPGLRLVGGLRCTHRLENSHHKWNIKITGFDPAELTVLGVAPGLVQAPINLQLNGSGTLSKDLKTSLVFDNPEISAKIKELQVEGNFADYIPGLKPDGKTSVLAKPKNKEATGTRSIADAEATLDDFLANQLTGLSTSVQLKEASFTLKKPKTAIDIIKAKLSLKNGVIATDESVHTSFAEGAVDISGSYTSSHNFKRLFT